MHNNNAQLFLFITDYAGKSAALDDFFLFVTTPLIFFIASICTIYIVIVRPLYTKDPIVRLRAVKDALFFIANLLLVWGVVEIIKGAVAFPRPHQYFHGARTLLIYGDFDSFPSLHAAFSFALAYMISLRHKTLGILLFVAAVLVSFSRVFVGVHFPIDILAGAAIGLFIPWIVRTLTVR